MMFLPAADEKSLGWDWLRTLDFAQIAIVAITAYLYFFYSPSRWLASTSDIPRQILILYIIRDAFLSLGFFVRSRNATSRGLRSFTSGLFLVFLLALLSDTEYLVTLHSSIGGASWGDFLFLFPWLAVIILAVVSARRGQNSITEPVSHFGDLAVAEQAFGRRECAQHFEATCQRRHEFAVAMRGRTRSLDGRDFPGLMTGFQGHDAVSLPECACFI